ncbi:hypothetical protein PYCC9005_004479 [Savitreella phatthalungensis]
MSAKRRTGTTRMSGGTSTSAYEMSPIQPQSTPSRAVSSIKQQKSARAGSVKKGDLRRQVLKTHTSTPQSIDFEHGASSHDLHIHKESASASASPRILNLADDDDFVRSLNFSPIKVAPAAVVEVVHARKALATSTPSALNSKIIKGPAYEVIVDYDSDDQPFTFSPMKPASSSDAPSGAMESTPSKVKPTNKRTVRSASPRKRQQLPTAEVVKNVSPERADSPLLHMQPLQMSPRMPPTRQSRRLQGLSAVVPARVTSAASSSASPMPKMTRAHPGVRSTETLEMLEVPAELLRSRHEEARLAADREARLRRKASRKASAHRHKPTQAVSPRLGISRKVSEANPTSRPIQNEIIANLDGDDGVGIPPPAPMSQPSQPPAAVPGRAFISAGLKRALRRSSVKLLARSLTSPDTQPSPPATREAVNGSRKRKATDMTPDSPTDVVQAGLMSPAKRVKLPLPTRRSSGAAGVTFAADVHEPSQTRKRSGGRKSSLGMPARRSTSVNASLPLFQASVVPPAGPTMPTKPEIVKRQTTHAAFTFTSDAQFQERAAKREDKLARTMAAETARRRLPTTLGHVPRTLYSPAKLPDHQPSHGPAPPTPTQPAPFNFATQSRADRRAAQLQSDSPVAEPVRTATVKREVKVAVLSAAPFVPRPSTHTATVAQSPERAVESRLADRRAFDAIANERARQERRRRKQQEEALAQKREINQANRQSAKLNGLAAISAWQAAAASNPNKASKHAWVD